MSAWWDVRVSRYSQGPDSEPSVMRRRVHSHVQDSWAYWWRIQTGVCTQGEQLFPSYPFITVYYNISEVRPLPFVSREPALRCLENWPFLSRAHFLTLREIFWTAEVALKSSVMYSGASSHGHHHNKGKQPWALCELVRSWKFKAIQQSLHRNLCVVRGILCEES